MPLILTKEIVWTIVATTTKAAAIPKDTVPVPKAQRPPKAGPKVPERPTTTSLTEAFLAAFTGWTIE